MPELLIPTEDVTGALKAAAARRVAVSVTCYDRNRWVTLRGVALAVTDDAFWMEEPIPTARQPSEPLALGMEVGLSFRRASFRYSGLVKVTQFGKVRVRGEEFKAMAVGLPERLQQIDRRVYTRVPILDDQKARASFWPGGRSVEPQGLCADRPVWGGSLVDLSMNGFALRTTWDAGTLLEPGDIVGARLQFGDSPAPVYVNAALRHVAQEGTLCVLGFQLVAMEDTQEGRDALGLIARRFHEVEDQLRRQVEAEAAGRS